MNIDSLTALGKEAMKNGELYKTNGGQYIVRGVISNGVKFEDWFENDSKTKINNYYPVVNWSCRAEKVVE